jgi:hypothetical protein
VQHEKKKKEYVCIRLFFGFWLPRTTRDTCIVVNFKSNFFPSNLSWRRCSQEMIREICVLFAFLSYVMLANGMRNRFIFESFLERIRVYIVYTLYPIFLLTQISRSGVSLCNMRALVVSRKTQITVMILFLTRPMTTREHHHHFILLTILSCVFMMRGGFKWMKKDKGIIATLKKCTTTFTHKVLTCRRMEKDGFR